MSDKKKGLTARQERFCEEYIIDKSLTEAAVRAGYSRKCAVAVALRNMKIAEVKNRIDNALKEQSKRIEITADRVILEIARIAFMDIKNIFDENGNLKRITELPEDISRAISSVEVSRSKNVDDDTEYELIAKIKLWDKVKALELLSKHFNLLGDNSNDKDADIYLTTIINSFNRRATTELSEEEQEAIGTRVGLLEKALSAK